MRNLIRRAGAGLLAVLTAFALMPAAGVKAAEQYEEELSVFISFTGSGAEAGDRGLVYAGPGRESSTGITAVTASAAVGDTVTVSLTFPEEVTGVYDIAPVIVSQYDNIAIENVTADVALKVNGEDVEINLEESEDIPISWESFKDDYKTAWRLYGGIEEGGLKYVDANVFKGATSIEYTITIKSADETGPACEGEARVFIAFDGDLAESGDHGLKYYGEGNEENAGDIEAVEALAKVGDTVTVSLTLPSALRHAYFVSPVIVPEEGTEYSKADVTVALNIDGSVIALDETLTAGAWDEALPGIESAWRLYGGADDAGSGTVEADLFAGVTKIEYRITINSLYEVPKEPEPEPEPEVVSEEPAPEEIAPAPVEPVSPEVPAVEDDSQKGLVMGIVIAIIAVIMIIAGALLSRKKDPDESKDNKKNKNDDDLDIIDLSDSADELEEAEDEAEEISESKAAAAVSGAEEIEAGAENLSGDLYSDLPDLDKEMKRIDSVIAKGPYTDDWSSLSKNGIPKWFADAKFGIFIHWGAFTSEEYKNEWYPRSMYTVGSDENKHHVEKYGPLSETGYIDYIDRFKGEKFDPDNWMDVFKKSGARYVIPVGEHHDGFQMYKSKASHWNAFEKGPCKDTCAMLQESADKYGVKFGISSHRFEHWWFLGNGRRSETDIKGEYRRGDLYWPSVMDPEDIQDFDVKPAPSEEFMQDWLFRVCEMVDKFLPEVIYFDWWIGQSALKPYLKKAAAYYYDVMESKGLKGIMVAKSDAFGPGACVRDIERGGLSGAAAYTWQSDTPICRQSWGYVKDADYKGASEVVRELVDIVSKNGNLLLNVGPKADGTLCDEEKEVLLGIGKWLDVNGEMIYGSRPYKIYGEGSVNREEGGFKDAEVLDYTSGDFRFTEKDGNIYAAAMKPSSDGHYLIKSMAKKGEDGSSSYKGILSDVVLLAGGKTVKWNHLDNGLEIETDYIPGDDMPVVFKIVLK